LKIANDDLPRQHECAQEIERQRGDAHAGDASGETNAQTLDEEQPAQSRATGAERGADGELVAAAFRSDEQEVGDRRARQEHRDCARAEQNRHELTQIARRFRPQRLAQQRRKPGARTWGRRGAMTVVNATRFFVGLIEAHAVVQPRRNRQEHPAAIGERGWIRHEAR